MLLNKYFKHIEIIPLLLDADEWDEWHSSFLGEWEESWSQHSYLTKHQQSWDTWCNHWPDSLHFQFESLPVILLERYQHNDSPISSLRKLFLYSSEKVLNVLPPAALKEVTSVTSLHGSLLECLKDYYLPLKKLMKQNNCNSRKSEETDKVLWDKRNDNRSEHRNSFTVSLKLVKNRAYK